MDELFLNSSSIIILSSHRVSICLFQLARNQLLFPNHPPLTTDNFSPCSIIQLPHLLASILANQFCPLSAWWLWIIRLAFVIHWFNLPLFSDHISYTHIHLHLYMQIERFWKKIIQKSALEEIVKIVRELFRYYDELLKLMIQKTSLKIFIYAAFFLLKNVENVLISCKLLSYSTIWIW